MPGDRFDDLSGARASLAVAVGTCPIDVEDENLPAVVLGDFVLFLLDVLEVGQPVNLGQQAFKFGLDLVGASLDASDPRIIVGIKELGTTRRSAGNSALEQTSFSCHPSTLTIDPFRRR